jgi:hypothetical protein
VQAKEVSLWGFLAMEKSFDLRSLSVRSKFIVVVTQSLLLVKTIFRC